MDQSLIREARFVVRVPIMATYTEFDLEHSGVFINDKGRGKERYFGEDLTAVGWTIYQMAKAHSEGYPVKLVSGGDVTYIYGALQNFLEELHTLKRFSPNDPKIIVSDEDLQLLDSFAEEVFNINVATLKLKAAEERKEVLGFNNEANGILEHGLFANNTDSSSEMVRKSYKPRKALNVTELLKNT